MVNCCESPSCRVQDVLILRRTNICNTNECNTANSFSKIIYLKETVKKLEQDVDVHQIHQIYSSRRGDKHYNQGCKWLLTTRLSILICREVCRITFTYCQQNYYNAGSGICYYIISVTNYIHDGVREWQVLLHKELWRQTHSQL
jgi:hypothetical protein